MKLRANVLCFALAEKQSQGWKHPLKKISTLHFALRRALPRARIFKSEPIATCIARYNTACKEVSVRRSVSRLVRWNGPGILAARIIVEPGSYRKSAVSLRRVPGSLPFSLVAALPSTRSPSFVGLHGCCQSLAVTRRRGDISPLRKHGSLNRNN